MPDRVHIIGVGSPFGDDRLGWVAAESLQRSSVLNSLEPGRIAISIMDRPGAMLLALWDEADHVILMDGVRSGAVPGTRHRLTAGDVTDTCIPATSHGFGIAAALQLAQVLENLPNRLLLRGIEMDVCCTGFTLSAAVTAAMPHFVREIEEETLALAGAIHPFRSKTASESSFFAR
ncbi:hydrogenase maturation protease [Sulfuricaulis sp.]|jgi:hydrogenase maturation protease|uniref:hydrogenase maturation protease n=1 Tax=Sulfuricaulis sp. TaxID=2003553 RepID=UPI00355A46D2